MIEDAIVQSLKHERFSSKPYSLKALERTGLELRTEEIANPAEVIAKVRIFAPEQGWLCFTDKVCTFIDGRVPESKFPILSAEVARKGRSLHVRQSEGNGWIVVEMGEKEGSTHLREEVKLLADPDPKDRESIGFLNYVRYWQLDEDAPFFACSTARFTGFMK